MVSDFADFKAGYSGSLFAQGSERRQLAASNVTMSIASGARTCAVFPEFSIFATRHVHQDAAHQVRVFNDPLMDPFKKKAGEDGVGAVTLRNVFRSSPRQFTFPRSEKNVMTPADLAGVNLRMPGTDAWQFLGKALGASPTPLSFNEVYTALASGAVDGQTIRCQQLWIKSSMR